MWYGLQIDDTLAAVKWFSRQPAIFDFDVSTSSDHIYRVVVVSVTVTGSCAPLS
jgi:hypothetical protein